MNLLPMVSYFHPNDPFSNMQGLRRCGQYRGDQEHAVLDAVVLNQPDVFLGAMHTFMQNRLASTETVDLFLTHCANPNQRTQAGVPLLSEAIQRNHPRAFKLLLRQPGININKVDAFGQSPLLVALKQTHYAAARMLVRRGADVTQPDQWGGNALDWAALTGNSEFLTWMLQHQSGETVTPVYQQWLQALAQSQCNAVRTYAGMPHEDKMEWLWEAIKRGMLREVVALITAGASVRYQYVQEYTPLAVAALYGEAEIARFLLARGADVNAGGYEGFTPLLLASGNHHPEMVSLLLLSEADVNHKTITDDTALILGAANGSEACLTLLLAAGANPNHANEADLTALTVAARYGQMQAVQTLLKCPALDIKAQGREAASMARQNGHAEISDIILTALAKAENRAGCSTLTQLWLRFRDFIEI